MGDVGCINDFYLGFYVSACIACKDDFLDPPFTMMCSSCRGGEANIPVIVDEALTAAAARYFTDSKSKWGEMKFKSPDEVRESGKFILPKDFGSLPPGEGILQAAKEMEARAKGSKTLCFVDFCDEHGTTLYTDEILVPDRAKIIPFRGGLFRIRVTSPYEGIGSGAPTRRIEAWKMKPEDL